MSLSARTQLGPYEIVAPLGAGGMGEVYRARDTKLDRAVAIKVLPDTFARDPERVARFEREAKVLASLNHPNIAAIYGFEESEDKRFLVLELVEGETLAERLRGGALAVNEALEVCKQMAEALEAAHERGVIHRDLKPANVMVTPDGVVKVLDFGLAKAFAGDTSGAALADSPTITVEHTRPGVVLGTAAYMSPEQARGKPLDKRTDIWSFGCVLYECLTGRRSFEGETGSDTLAAILKGEPEWTRLPDALPPNIRILLRRCLEKEPSRRLRDIGDARIEIIDALAEPRADVEASAARGRQRHKTTPFALTALAAALLSGALVWNVIRPPMSTTPTVSRFKLRLPNGQHLVAPKGLAEIAGRYPPIALCQDGTMLAYVAVSADDPPQLFVRELDRLQARPLSGTENAELPFFAPDCAWVGFLVGGTVFKVAVDGGNPVEIGEVPGTARGACWAADDTMILGGANRGLFRLDAGGGTPVEITRPNSERGEQYHAWPEVLPNGEHVLFTAVTGVSWDAGVLSMKTDEWRILERTEGAAQPHYLESGLLVSFRAGGLFATPFDLTKMAPGDATIPVLDDPLMGWNAGLDIGYFAVSRSGSLAYVPGGPAAQENRLVLVDRDGREEPLPAESGRYGYGPSISPDGERLAVGNNTRGSTDLWVHELDQSRRARLTDEESNIFPVWSADGERVIFALFKAGSASFDLYWTPADEGKPEPLMVREHDQFPTSSSRDGLSLVFTEINPVTGSDIYLLPLEGDRLPSSLVTTPANEREASISPDGLFLAYVSDATGRDEVYVKSLSGGGRNTPISTDGGRWPRWASKGDELFYRSASAMMAVQIEFEPTVRAGTPQKLFEGRYEIWYDVMPGGDHFVMLKRELVELTEMIVVLNWSEELRAKVPTGTNP